MNIAKLNTASLDDKTFIIKRGTSGGGSTPDTPSGGGDVFYVAAEDELAELSMAAICSLIKYRNEETGDMLIAGPGAYFMIAGNAPMTALAFLCLGDLEMYDGDNKTTVRGKYEELKQYTTFAEITKEQFYSLE